MKIKVKIKKKEIVDEISAGGGFGGGYGAPADVKELDEMFSTQGIHGDNTRREVKPEKVQAAWDEWKEVQGLKNEGLDDFDAQDVSESRIFRIKIMRNPQK